MSYNEHEVEGVSTMVVAKKREAIWSGLVAEAAWLAAGLAVLLPIIADADEIIYRLPDVEIIGVTPLLGSGAPLAEVPSTVHVLDKEQLDDGLDLAAALNQSVGGLTVLDVQNNPYQKDIQLRGYTLSPLLGTPQGLAVYQNGMRINEPFGDVIQWDTVPEFALGEVQVVVGANPIFGLNAIGGAIALRTKNGFDNPIRRLRLASGSWGRVHGHGEAGWTSNDKSWAAYVGVGGFREDGWRDFSPSDVQQLFGDIRHRTDNLDFGMNITATRSSLTGNGPLPIELMRENRSVVYTYPDITDNQTFTWAMDADWLLSDSLSIQGLAYYRYRHRDTLNGDEYEADVCGAALAFNNAPLPPGGDPDDAAIPGVTGWGTLCDGKATSPANFKYAARSANLPDGKSIGDDIAGSDALGDGRFILTSDAEEEGNGRRGVLELNIGAEVSDDDPNLVNFAAEEASGGAINRSRTITNAFGVGLQSIWYNVLIGHNNNLITGISFDYAGIDYASSTELGSLNDSRGIDVSNIRINAQGLGIPTGLGATTRYLGFYLSDTLALTDDLDLIFAGRWNWANITMTDKIGTDLNGNHYFNRLNPSIGFNYDFDAGNIYIRYAEANRVPTPGELSCADPDKPCRVPNAFVADPPLEQVVNRSIELGARGLWRYDNDLSMRWNAAIFGGRNANDIIWVAGNAIGSGYFQNAGTTQRMGVELGLQGQWQRLSWFVNYSYTRATFESTLLLPKPNADEDATGVERYQNVTAGDQIPGIPLHIGKVGLGYQVTDAWHIGVNAIIAGEQYLRGDEANERAPVEAYGVVNLESRYGVNEQMSLFIKVNNLLDTKYETFGIVAENPSEVLGDNYTDPRFIGVGAPLGVWVGVDFNF